MTLSRILFVALAVWAATVAVPAAAPADPPQVAVPVIRSGQELYLAACAACHGADGTGVARASLGFDVEVPDFTECSFATPEADADWLAVAHQGGPVRAFDRRMPAFGEALSEDELLRIIGHVRTFCGSRDWPRGELNLPRALVTEKAFPENEAVWTTAMTASDTDEIGNELLFERRFGARNQFEVVVPVMLQRDLGAGWSRGLGDVAVAVKRVLFHSLEAGRILSVAGEVVLPTGKESAGLGKGITVFEPFLAFGQILPSDGFVQVQAGAELPAGGEDTTAETFARLAIGKTFVQGRFGRSWSPMIEVLAARDMEAGERITWALVPQMQVSLSKRQHILLSGGLHIALNATAGRDVQVLTYLLWDWWDGGFFSGWR